jgi:NitT/TauT family transport system ATP-binding protein
LIAGFAEPDGGTISVCGTNPAQALRQSKFGIVFQNPVLFDWLTVEQNVRLPLDIKHVPKNESCTITAELLQLAGLSDFADLRPFQLSGGMKQRASIARSLAGGAEILLMDEPFSALDEFTREQQCEALLEIWSESKKTILFVTHNIEEAVFLSDKVFVFSSLPGNIKKTCTIALPRPRNSALRTAAEFFAHTAEVRREIGGG